MTQKAGWVSKANYLFTDELDLDLIIRSQMLESETANSF